MFPKMVSKSPEWVTPTCQESMDVITGPRMRRTSLCVWRRYGRRFPRWRCRFPWGSRSAPPDWWWCSWWSPSATDPPCEKLWSEAREGRSAPGNCCWPSRPMRWRGPAPVSGRREHLEDKQKDNRYDPSQLSISTREHITLVFVCPYLRGHYNRWLASLIPMAVLTEMFVIFFLGTRQKHRGVVAIAPQNSPLSHSCTSQHNTATA